MSKFPNLRLKAILNSGQFHQSSSLIRNHNRATYFNSNGKALSRSSSVTGVIPRHSSRRVKKSSTLAPGLALEVIVSRLVSRWRCRSNHPSLIGPPGLPNPSGTQSNRSALEESKVPCWAAGGTRGLKFLFPGGLPSPPRTLS